MVGSDVITAAAGSGCPITRFTSLDNLEDAWADVLFGSSTIHQASEAAKEDEIDVIILREQQTRRRLHSPNNRMTEHESLPSSSICSSESSGIKHVVIRQRRPTFQMDVQLIDGVRQHDPP